MNLALLRRILFWDLTVPLTTVVGIFIGLLVWVLTDQIRSAYDQLDVRVAGFSSFMLSPHWAFGVWAAVLVYLGLQRKALTSRQRIAVQYGCVSILAGLAILYAVAAYLPMEVILEETRQFSSR